MKLTPYQAIKTPKKAETTPMVNPASFSHPAKAAVQNGHITQKRDQGPGFLGVPSPETAPGIIGPDPAQDGSRRQQHDPHLHHPVKELGLLLSRS